MVNLIVFECIDVAVTLAAASTLLRFVVARPALGLRAAVTVETCEDAAGPGTLEVLVAAVEDEVADEDEDEAGISWPEPTWSGLAVA